MGRGCHREPSPLQHRCPRPGVKEGLITAGPHWGILAPGGLSCKQQWGERAHSTPQPFYPAPSLHYRVLLVSQVPHSQPYLGTVLPPSPLPGPYRVKAHPVPGGGSTVGGGAVPLSAAAAFPLPSSPGHVCWKGPERGGGHCGVGASPLRQPSLLWGGAGSGVLGGGALG